jgi:lambda family phage portal protein
MCGGSGPHELDQSQSRSATYAAAQFNRLTNDWFSQRTSANAEARRSLRTLRARSRELSRNDDHMKKFLSMVASNVAGPHGIKLQVKVKDGTGERDQKLAKLVQDAWADWSHKENASASGKLSWVDMQRMFPRTTARDGEVLVRKIVADNRFGFALKFLDVDWLDETYNTLLPNGNRILMSVEVNKFGKPVAYYLTPPSYDYLYPENAGQRQRQRVPAEEIIHRFLILDGDEEQARGVPWAHTAMMRLQMLGAYEEASLIAAQVSACVNTYLVPPASDEDAGIPDEDDGEPGNPPIEDSMQPGTIRELQAGWDVKTVDPSNPNPNQPGFIKSMLRGVASGLDVTYVSLANDLEGVNLSSIRVGRMEERDVWRYAQAWEIEHFCRDVYLSWLESAFLTGALPGVSVSDYKRLREPHWHARGWAYDDPVKETQAAVLAINNGLDCRTDELAENGKDFGHVVKMLAQEQALAKQEGVSLAAGAPAPVTVTKEEGTEGDGGDETVKDEKA